MWHKYEYITDWLYNKKKNLIYISVATAVKITNLSIPATYILDRNNPEPLKLDCEYEMAEKEEGFVLKWFHDSSQIYQWIPSLNRHPERLPVAMVRNEPFHSFGDNPHNIFFIVRSNPSRIVLVSIMKHPKIAYRSTVLSSSPSPCPILQESIRAMSRHIRVVTRKAANCK